MFSVLECALSYRLFLVFDQVGKLKLTVNEEKTRICADHPHPALGQDLTPSSTARRAQAGSDVRARSARRSARAASDQDVVGLPRGRNRRSRSEDTHDRGARQAARHPAGLTPLTTAGQHGNAKGRFDLFAGPLRNVRCLRNPAVRGFSVAHVTLRFSLCLQGVHVRVPCSGSAVSLSIGGRGKRRKLTSSGWRGKMLPADGRPPRPRPRRTKPRPRRAFEADVSRLLHLMVHSVYSDREIFVRELVLKPSRPGWLRPPSHPTRCLRPAHLGCEPARRGFHSAAAKPGSSNPAIPVSVRSPRRA